MEFILSEKMAMSPYFPALEIEIQTKSPFFTDSHSSLEPHLCGSHEFTSLPHLYILNPLFHQIILQHPVVHKAFSGTEGVIVKKCSLCHI